MDRLRAILQPPDVCKTGIRTTHQLRRHHVRHYREVQSSVLAGKRHAIQARRCQHFMILLRLWMVVRSIALHPRPLRIDHLRVRRQSLRANLPNYRQHTAIIIKRIFKIQRAIPRCILMRKTILLQIHNMTHQRIPQLKTQRLVVIKKVRHHFSSLYPLFGIFLIRRDKMAHHLSHISKNHIIGYPIHRGLRIAIY